MTTTTASQTRTYRAILTSRAPYPLNWDCVAETFDTLEAAMEKAAEWQRKYPKGLAKGGGRSIQVDSWAGHRDGVLLGRKIHFDSKKAR
jgi:hypothetical protein